MKKFYEAPELELIKFHQEDVLGPSATGTGDDIYDVEGDSTTVGGGVQLPW